MNGGAAESRRSVLREARQSVLLARARRFAKWRERRSRVEKDVRRTDRAQPFYRAERCAKLMVI